jgi:hypothetical protein
MFGMLGHGDLGQQRLGRPAAFQQMRRGLGAGIEATVNKAASGNDAAFAFKTGFSARALIGLLGNDDFSFKVSPDGSTFFDALKIDRASGQGAPLLISKMVNNRPVSDCFHYGPLWQF